MLWFGFWRVAPFGTGRYVRTLTPHVMIMIMGYAVQYVCFMKRKCFVRFSVSLTEPVAHKNYILCCS